MWLPGGGGCLYSGEAGSSGAVFAGDSVLPVPNCLALTTTVKDGRVCCSKGHPTEVNSFLYSQLLVGIHSVHNCQPRKREAFIWILSKCQTNKQKKVEPRSRSPAFVNHVSPWLCHCTCVAKGMDFSTTDYW